MRRREISEHLRDLQREYKSIPDRDLDFEDWLTAQLMELNQQNIINDNIIKQYEIRVQQDIEKIEKLESLLTLRTIERDNWEKQFKDADKRCREIGTKNAKLYDAWQTVSKDKDRFVKALETCMYYSDPLRVHTDLDYDIIHKTAQKEIQAK